MLFYFKQCAIPVFEGLLPSSHNRILMKLLFTLAHWHALAKLRQHTDSSLIILESVTVRLGKLLREFKSKVSDVYYEKKKSSAEEEVHTQQIAKKKSGTLLKQKKPVSSKSGKPV